MVVGSFTQRVLPYALVHAPFGAAVLSDVRPGTIFWKGVQLGNARIRIANFFTFFAIPHATWQTLWSSRCAAAKPADATSLAANIPPSTQQLHAPIDKRHCHRSRVGMWDHRRSPLLTAAW
jgi:hypothetical protein